MHRKIVNAFLSVFLLLSAASCTMQRMETSEQAGRAKFEPAAGQVLVFAGQDNASVGGNGRFHDGYADNIGVPAGITHYVGMGADRANPFKTSYDDSRIDGLYTESQWGAGPMCLKSYMDSPILNPCIVHLSIAMTGNNEDEVADGTHDALIDELGRFLTEYKNRPFLLRIGYEFEGLWNHYDPEHFKAAFRRIVDKLQAAGVTNFATVMASSSVNTPYETWERYYPGDDYVDWVGYSYWGGDSTDGPSLQFARDKGKPVFIAESAPRGHFLDQEDGRAVWKEWFEPFFRHIQENSDVIRAFSYIDCNWDVQPMWKGGEWGNTRLEANEFIKGRWLEMMQDPEFVNAAGKPFRAIGFTPKARQAGKIPCFE